MHSTYRVAVFGSALNRKIFSPHSTGELCPIPGSSIFQFRSRSVQLAGIVFVSLSPVPFGPRKRVHSWAAAVETRIAVRAATENERSASFCMGRTSIQAGQLGRDMTLRADVT